MFLPTLFVLVNCDILPWSDEVPALEMSLARAALLAATLFIALLACELLVPVVYPQPKSWRESIGRTPRCPSLP
jgi:hypothetical protein